MSDYLKFTKSTIFLDCNAPFTVFVKTDTGDDGGAIATTKSQRGTNAQRDDFVYMLFNDFVYVLQECAWNTSRFLAVPNSQLLKLEHELLRDRP